MSQRVGPRMRLISEFRGKQPQKDTRRRGFLRRVRKLLAIAERLLRETRGGSAATTASEAGETEERNRARGGEVEGALSELDGSARHAAVEADLDVEGARVEVAADHELT